MRKVVDGQRLGFIPRMFPTLVEVPPEGDDWFHEIKYDGYRTQLLIEGGGIRAFSRRGNARKPVRTRYHEGRAAPQGLKLKAGRNGYGGALWQPCAT